MVVTDHNSQASKSLFCKNCAIVVDFRASWTGAYQATTWWGRGCWKPTLQEALSRIRSWAKSTTWLSENVGLPKHKLFLLFHRVHSTAAKSSGSLLPTKISSKISVKEEHAWSVLWFHWVQDLQTGCKVGQQNKAWQIKGVEYCNKSNYRRLQHK